MRPDVSRLLAMFNLTRGLSKPEELLSDFLACFRSFSVLSSFNPRERPEVKGAAPRYQTINRVSSSASIKIFAFPRL